MLYLKIIAAGLCLAFVWDAADAAEPCTNTTIKVKYVMKSGKRIPVAANKCCQGYVRQKYKCAPVCTTPCENSKCVAPNVCQCNEGYEQFSNSRCIPHCDGCDNGFCIKPGNCQCNSQYVHTEDGSCVPECNNCGNGFCSEPNVCLCREGYALAGTIDNRTCEPVCDQGCPNGKCVGPNECSCDDGFLKDEGGRCVPEAPPTTTPEPCRQGYQELNGSCVPVCSEQCINGKCAAPNTCECNAGFSSKNSTAWYHCQPVCSNGCLNGNCLAPGKCICHKGYGKIADECIPLCEKCSLGHCVRPEVCQCDRGYELIDGDCVPICEEECKNAKCTGPNSCTCLPGFNYTDINSLFECLPVCEDDCDNGSCVAPNTCECNQGFVKNEYDACVDPIEICRARCLNGFCNREAKCQCNRGYIMNAIGLCERTCPEGCANGECVGGSCLCHEGYRLSLTNASVCEPVCGGEDDYEDENVCVNGQCVEPNVCQCDEGFDFVDDSRMRCQSLEEIRKQKEQQQREKLCSKECSSGVCEQGYCQCSVGYVNPEGQDYRCVALCEPGCRNGSCILPNRCECELGYEFYGGSKSDCYHKEDVLKFKLQAKQEVCEEKCNNGVCEDGKCSCSAGFRSSADDEFNCEPYCEKPCLNGICAGNNQCRCFEGYENVNDGRGCEPICEDECINGRCIEPNRCLCNSGYVFEDRSSTICELEKSAKGRRRMQQVCEEKCSNGICVEGVCRCEVGYQADQAGFTCEPVCELDCKNGRCVAPNICGCLDGFEESKDRGCVPVCEQDCENGFCGAPGRCDCFPGYKLKDNTNVCEPVCGDGCTNGYCVSPDVCECFQGYKQKEDNNTQCDLIPEIVYKVDRNSLVYYKAYMPYVIPLVVIVVLSATAIITMIVLRHKKKDYHVGKLETKENCVYFMPQVPNSAKEDEEKFQV